MPGVEFIGAQGDLFVFWRAGARPSLKLGDMSPNSKAVTCPAPYAYVGTQRRDRFGNPKGIRGETVPIGRRLIGSRQMRVRCRKYHRNPRPDARGCDLAACAAASAGRDHPVGGKRYGVIGVYHGPMASPGGRI